MSCEITYPSNAGCNCGAIDADGFLISCCGRWTRPSGSEPGSRCQIFGKVYTSLSDVEGDLPNDAFEGTLLPFDDAELGGFHFNTSILPGAVIGATNWVKVWLVALDIGLPADPFGPRQFMGCEFGAAGCDDPPCIHDGEDDPTCLCDLAIDVTVPTEYQVGPDRRTVSLFEMASKTLKAGSLGFDSIRLNYSLELSTPTKAVWVVQGKAQPECTLRLDLVRAARGRYTATLYLLRIGDKGVEPASRWQSKCFHPAIGGPLDAIDANGRRTGGAVVVSVRRGKQRDKLPRAQPRIAEESRKSE